MCNTLRIVCLAFCVVGALSATAPQDTAALVDLFNATNGAQWKDSSGWLVGDPCSWDGVTCDDDRVTQLSLQYNNLEGTIPDSFGGLTQLQNLYLDGNKLRGTIPESFWGMSQLVFVGLSSNMLQGTIPDTVSGFTQLEEFDLSSNHLSGSIPPSIGRLVSLEGLQLDGNHLNGTIPESIGNLVQMTTLYLSYNELSGGIPESIGNCERLADLQLPGNALTGSIPETFGRLSQLMRLYLSTNKLSGSIPDAMWTLVQLTDLCDTQMDGNHLSGSIPESIANLTLLSSLNMNLNKLTGSIPTSICRLPQLNTLYLQQNTLSGSIPNSITECGSLGVLGLSSNQLTGGIPDGIGSLALIDTLLDDNRLSGSIPPSLAGLTECNILNLSGNYFTGNVSWLPATDYANCEVELTQNCLTPDPTTVAWCNNTAHQCSVLPQRTMCAPPTPPLLPPPPSNLSAVPAPHAASLTWTPPPSTPVDNYTVIATPSTGTSFSIVSNSSPTTFLNLTPGVAYQFDVSSTNVNGSGPPSPPTAWVVPCGRVGVPQSPTTVAATPLPHGARVSWQLPLNDGCLPIMVCAVNATSGPYSATVPIPASPTSPTPRSASGVVTNVPPGSTNSFTVACSNADGEGPPSPPSSPVTIPSPPSAPFSVEATPGNASATITWHAPHVDGGLPITLYEVKVDPSSVTVNTTSPTPTTATIPNLINGMPYTFSVAAVNAAGVGAWGTPSSPVTPRGHPVPPPSPPSNIKPRPAINSIILTWTPPGDDGGSPIINTTAVVTDGSGLSFTSPALEITASDLVPGQAYSFRLFATNAFGESPESLPCAPAAPLAHTGVPGVPTITSAVGGDSSAVVTWHAPQSDGGSTIAQYAVGMMGSLSTINTTQTSTTVPHLVNGRGYRFHVKACNINGCGSWSVWSTVAIPHGGAMPPSAPVGVKARGGPASMTVTWGPPVDDGGSPVLVYEVEVGGRRLNTTLLDAQVATQAMVECRVRALNGEGWGVWSLPVPGSPTVSPPGPPLDVHGNGVGRTSVEVHVAPPASDGGSPIQCYTVTSIPDGKTSTCVAPTADAGGVVVTVDGLRDGVGYVFTANATNVVGTGPPSPPTADPCTPGTRPPGPVSSVHVSPLDATSLAVSWAYPKNDGGTPVQEYFVATTDGHTGPTVRYPSQQGVVGGLDTSLPYKVCVTPITCYVSGPVVCSSTAVAPLATVPGAPASLSAASFASNVTLRWTPPLDDGGSVITAYAVRSGGINITTTDEFAVVGGGDGLKRGVSYVFEVSAVNDVGEGVGVASPPLGLGDVLPSPPTAVNATSFGPGCVSAVWAPSARHGSAVVSEFIVWMRNSSTSDGVESVVVGTALNATVCGLRSDGPVGYTSCVAARSTVGTGKAACARYPVTPAAEHPSSPTSVSPVDVVPGGEGVFTVKVEWAPPLHDGGLPVVNYTLYSTKAGRADWAPVWWRDGRIGYATGLESGVGYQFAVSAINAAGLESELSAASVVVVPDPDAPPAPTFVNASLDYFEEGVVNVMWQLPAQAEVSGGEKVVVVAQPVGASTVNTTTAVVAASSFKAPITLHMNQTYTVYVYAEGEGTSAWTAGPEVAVVPVRPAGARDVVARGDHQTLFVEWKPPVKDGGSELLYYTVSAGLVANTSASHVQVVVYSGQNTTAVLGGVMNGFLYGVQVTATNAALESALATSAQDGVMPCGAPGPPTDAAVSAARHVAGQAVVSWAYDTSPSYVECAGVAGFNVVALEEPSGVFGARLWVDSNHREATFTGLDVTKLYGFSVAAVNSPANFTSTVSRAGSVSPCGHPHTPPSVSAVSLGAGRANVSWVYDVKEPSMAECARVTGFVVQARRWEDPKESIIAAWEAGAETFSVVHGLPVTEEYVFTVVAVNSAGLNSTSPSPESNGPVVLCGQPGTPTNVAASVGSHVGGEATVAWAYNTAASNVECVGVAGFTVVALEVASGAAAGRVWVGGNDRGATFSGLDVSQQYTFAVVAVNSPANLTSKQSQPSAVVSPCGHPVAPATVRAVSLGAGRANVSWVYDVKEPSMAECAGVTGFVVQARRYTGGSIVAEAEVGANVFASMSGLPVTEEYVFTVVAVNNAGLNSTSPSPASNGPVLVCGTPGPPTGVVAAGGSGDAVVSWAYSHTAAYMECGSIESFAVVDMSSGRRYNVSGDAERYTVRRLHVDTKYSFSVVAVNNAGLESEPSVSASTTVSPPLFDIPWEAVLGVIGGLLALCIVLYVLHRRSAAVEREGDANASWFAVLRCVVAAVTVVAYGGLLATFHANGAGSRAAFWVVAVGMAVSVVLNGVGVVAFRCLGLRSDFDGSVGEYYTRWWGVWVPVFVLSLVDFNVVTVLYCYLCGARSFRLVTSVGLRRQVGVWSACVAVVRGGVVLAGIGWNSHMLGVGFGSGGVELLAAVVASVAVTMNVATVVLLGLGGGPGRSGSYVEMEAAAA